ncbi:uncharacterized protein LOC142343983 isoform X1 [Convolutriloba macropyga]|uniref:uncharacterized protein LOC142343983 isoform X1 n=1 Tax=Convolutriloba macropyga TaxID=536237 RepID=UPI003F527406
MNHQQQAQMMRNRSMVPPNAAQVPPNQNISIANMPQYYDQNPPNTNQLPMTASMQTNLQPGMGQYQQQPANVSNVPQSQSYLGGQSQHQQQSTNVQGHPNSSSSLGSSQNTTSSSGSDSNAAKATDVVNRLKVLSDRHLKDSLSKLMTCCVMAVNNQGGRDNGATDVSSSTSGSVVTSSSGGEKDPANEYSNVALGQAAEECMALLDQIEMNLQLSIDWTNQLKIMDKFCSPQMSQLSPQDQQYRNITTEDFLSGYAVHKEYSDKMTATIDDFFKQLSSISSNEHLSSTDGMGTTDSHDSNNVNSFACSALL